MARTTNALHSPEHHVDSGADSSAARDAADVREGGAPTDAQPDAMREAAVADGSTDDAKTADARADADAGDPPYAGPHFVDVAALAGIDYVQTASWNCRSFGSFDCDPEGPLFAGGALARDVDLDGVVDLAASRFDGASVLYLGQGDGTFVESGATAGFGQIPLLNGLGAADIDNDGDPDVFATGLGTDRYYLYVNDGSGGFTEEAIARGAAVESSELHEGTSVAFGDYDRDGYLDIYVCEWKPAAGYPSYARLLHNRGAVEPGYFDDVTSSAGVSLDGLTARGTVGFSPTFSDLDDDGWPDLAIVGDFGSTRLFWNDADGSFTDGTAAASLGTEENGMGSAIADWDGDGDLDWFVTSVYDPLSSCTMGLCAWGSSGNRLYAYDGSRLFRDETDGAGVRDAAWGWGAAFFDPDNDGDLDLVAASGLNISALVNTDQFRATGLRFWENLGDGRMREVAVDAGLGESFDAKAVVVVDYDADGDEDLFVTSNGGPPRLFRNDAGNASAWLDVRLVGTSSAHDAFGARVTVRRGNDGASLLRELQGGSSYLSTNDPVLHFGLGAPANVTEIRIRWPRTGSEQVLTDVTPNQAVTVTEP